VSCDNYPAHTSLFKTHYVNYYLTIENGIFFNNLNINLFADILKNSKIIKSVSENLIKLQIIFMKNNILLIQDRNHYFRLLTNQVFSDKVIILEGEAIYLVDVLDIIEKYNLKKNNFRIKDCQNFERIKYFIKNIECFNNTPFFYFIKFISWIYYSLIFDNNEFNTIFYLLKSYLFIVTNQLFLKKEKKSLVFNFFCKSEIFQLQNLLKNIIFIYNNSFLFEKKIKISKSNEYPLENIFSDVKSLRMNNGNLNLKDILESFSQLNELSTIKKKYKNKEEENQNFKFVNQKDLNTLYFKAIEELIKETKNIKLKNIRISFKNEFLKINENFEENKNITILNNLDFLLEKFKNKNKNKNKVNLEKIIKLNNLIEKPIFQLNRKERYSNKSFNFVQEKNDYVIMVEKYYYSKKYLKEVKIKQINNGQKILKSLNTSKITKNCVVLTYENLFKLFKISILFDYNVFK
jgi:hypothetical protein